jgi:hypothetical protein
MTSLPRKMRRQAERQALKEMRTTELKEVSMRTRRASIGDVQDMVEYGTQQVLQHLHDRKWRVRAGRYLLLRPWRWVRQKLYAIRSREMQRRWLITEAAQKQYRAEQEALAAQRGPIRTPFDVARDELEEQRTASPEVS